jgi:hypothetical protein
MSWWGLAKDHVTGEVFKIGVHRQREPKVVCEEVLCRDLGKGEDKVEKTTLEACWVPEIEAAGGLYKLNVLAGHLMALLFTNFAPRRNIPRKNGTMLTCG